MSGGAGRRGGFGVQQVEGEADFGGDGGDGEERGGGDASGFDFAEGFGGDSGAGGDVDDAAVAACGAQESAEVFAAGSFVRAQRYAHHVRDHTSATTIPV